MSDPPVMWFEAIVHLRQGLQIRRNVAAPFPEKYGQPQKKKGGNWHKKTQTPFFPPWGTGPSKNHCILHQSKIIMWTQITTVPNFDTKLSTSRGDHAYSSVHFPQNFGRKISFIESSSQKGFFFFYALTWDLGWFVTLCIEHYVNLIIDMFNPTIMWIRRL